MNCKRCSRVSIFFSFLRLGCLAFGGPIAHLGYFRDEYVRRRKWMTEAEYADLVALCQFLPGPASSQVGFAIGYRQGGLAGALLAWLGFTLPSAALMTGFALGVAGLQDFSAAGWIAGLKLAAVAVVAHAILEMGSKLCPDAAPIMIALGSAALLLLLSSAPWQLGVIAGGALIGLCLFQEKAIQPEAPVVRPARAGGGAGWYLILFSLLLLRIPLLRGIAPGSFGSEGRSRETNPRFPIVFDALGASNVAMHLSPFKILSPAAFLAFALALPAAEDVSYSMTDTPADVNAVPADAQTTDSGLASRVIKAGSGSESPAAADTVTVHYSGWTTDGELFDSSVRRGQPTSFPLNRVIPGWTEGLQLMVEGETRRFWIPAKLAYGENPGGGRPGGMLVFDVELIKIGR